MSEIILLPLLMLCCTYGLFTVIKIRILSKNTPETYTELLQIKYHKIILERFNHPSQGRICNGSSRREE